MKTTTRNKRIALTLLLLLLAIGGGIIFMRTRDNGGHEDKSYASLAWKMDTINVTRPATPVASPVLEATSAATPLGARVASASRKPRSAHRIVPADDQISLVSSKTFGGNMPLIPLAVEPDEAIVPEAVTPPPAKKLTTKVTTTEVTTSPRKYGRVNIAPEIGSNLNAFYNTNTTHMQISGFHAGAMVNISLGDHFALQPGARYIMKGNKDQLTAYGEGLAFTTTHKLTLNYAEMPLNAVYKFGDLGNARFMIGAGPYVGYLLSATDKEQTTVMNGVGKLDRRPAVTTAKTDLNKWDFGGEGFLGCQLPKGFYATMGVQMGVNDLQENPMDDSHADNNYDVFISIGYILGAKGKEY